MYPILPCPPRRSEYGIYTQLCIYSFLTPCVFCIRRRSTSFGFGLSEEGFISKAKFQLPQPFRCQYVKKAAHRPRPRLDFASQTNLSQDGRARWCLIVARWRFCLHQEQLPLHHLGEVSPLPSHTQPLSPLTLQKSRERCQYQRLPVVQLPTNLDNRQIHLESHLQIAAHARTEIAEALEF